MPKLLSVEPESIGVDANGQCQGCWTHNEVLIDKKVETVRLLIEQGADVTAQDENGSTPLHLASTSGILEIVWLLLECGACATARDESGKTPLHLASIWVSDTAEPPLF